MSYLEHEYFTFHCRTLKTVYAFYDQSINEIFNTMFLTFRLAWFSILENMKNSKNFYFAFNFFDEYQRNWKRAKLRCTQYFFNFTGFTFFVRFFLSFYPICLRSFNIPRKKYWRKSSTFLSLKEQNLSPIETLDYLSMQLVLMSLHKATAVQICRWWFQPLL